MPTAPWLTIVATEIGAFASHELRADSLARLAGRGALSHTWPRIRADTPLRPWQHAFIDALELASGSLASAPITAGVDGYWLQAQPVHFAAGLDRLTFVELRGESQLDDRERAALFDTLASSFSSGDFVLHSKGGEWFICAAHALQVTTSPPEAAATNDLSTVMPHGEDAPALRRLMTELQMLLHDHPVNEVRARRGLPAVNAIWPWGGGLAAEMKVSSDLPLALSIDSFALGLYRLSGSQIQSSPKDAQDLMQTIGAIPRALLVMPFDDLQVLDSQWLAPLSRALAQGRLSRLDLVVDGWHVDVRRADLRRFWRRALPPAQWQGQE